jgi:hypothetical protein
MHWQPDRSAVVRYRLRAQCNMCVQFAAVLVLLLYAVIASKGHTDASATAFCEVH